jgi:hypothetical protein
MSLPGPRRELCGIFTVFETFVALEFPATFNRNRLIPREIANSVRSGA